MFGRITVLRVRVPWGPIAAGFLRAWRQWNWESWSKLAAPLYYAWTDSSSRSGCAPGIAASRSRALLARLPSWGVSAWRSCSSLRICCPKANEFSSNLFPGLLRRRARIRGFLWFWPRCQWNRWLHFWCRKIRWRRRCLWWRFPQLTHLSLANELPNSPHWLAKGGCLALKVRRGLMKESIAPWLSPRARGIYRWLSVAR